MPQREQPWVRRWATDEVFWRDVSSNVLGGLVVIALAGLLTGSVAWVLSEDVRPVLLRILVDAVASIVVLVAYVAIGLVLYYRVPGRGWALAFAALLLPFFVFAAVIVVGIADWVVTI